MSRGISIYYKLISHNADKIIYGYSGADLNKKYDETKLLSYDGIIEIKMDAFYQEKDIIQALKDGDVIITKPCLYEWHHYPLKDENNTYEFFAVKVASKIFRVYKEQRKIEEKNGVVY